MTTLSRDYCLDTSMTFNYSTEELELEVKDEDAQLRELEVVAKSIQSQRIELESSGAVSRQDALALESLVPGSLPERYRPATFTLQPSPTNLQVALEANDTAGRNIVARFFIAAWALLVKIGKWVVDLFRGTKDLDKDVATASAQAITVSKIVAEVAASNPLLENTDIERLIEDSLIDQVRPHLSLLNVYLYDPKLENEQSVAYYRFIDEASEAIVGRALGHKGVVDDANLYLDGIERVFKGAGNATVEPPALLWRVVAAYTKLMSSGGRPTGNRLQAALSKSLTSGFASVQPQNPEYIKNRDEAYNVIAYLVRSGFEDDPKLNPSMLQTSTWLNPSNVELLEGLCRRGLVSLRVDPEFGSKLDTLTKRLEGFKNQSLKALDNLSDEVIEALRNDLKAVQNEFVVLSKIVAVFREQQERNIRLMVAIERGMTRVIAEIYKVAPKELHTRLQAITEAHKKAHAGLVKRLTDKGVM